MDPPSSLLLDVMTALPLGEPDAPVWILANSNGLIRTGERLIGVDVEMDPSSLLLPLDEYGGGGPQPLTAAATAAATALSGLLPLLTGDPPAADNAKGGL